MKAAADCAANRTARVRPWRGLRGLIGIALSLWCLNYVLAEVQWSTLWRLLRQANPIYLVGINLLLGLSFVLRAWRWQILLAPVRRVPWSPLFTATVVGYTVNNLLPVRLGEVVRALAGAHLGRAPLGGVVASLVVERLLDGLVMLAFIFTVLLVLGPTIQGEVLGATQLRAAAWTLLGVYLCALALLVACLRWPELVMRPLTAAVALLNKRLAVRWRQTLLYFQEGLGTLRRPSTLVKVLLLSVAVRVPILLMHWVFLPAVGLPLDPAMAAMATLGGGMASSLPSGPGYIGTYQLAVYHALLLCGAPEQRALAYSILYWAGQYFPLVAFGLFEAWRTGLTGAGLFSLKRCPPNIAQIRR